MCAAYLDFLAATLPQVLGPLLGPDFGELEATLMELREESAMCRGRVIVDGKRHANMTLVFVFEPGGAVPGGKQELLESHEREAFTTLGSPWLPPEPK